jgi:hypothetical protein
MSRPGLRRPSVKAAVNATAKAGVPGSFMALQRTAGNRAVAALVAAARSGREPLPRQTEVEAKLGLPLGEVRAQVDRSDLLGPVGASAAATPAGVLFAEKSPSVGTVVHEAAHMVQYARQALSGSTLPTGIAVHDSAAEREAEALASSAQAKLAGPVSGTGVLPTGAVQLNGKPLRMDKARGRAEAEREYHRATMEFEMRLGAYLSVRPETAEISDELLTRLKKVVDAWADATKQGKTTVYGTDFDFSTGQKYYGSFKTTGEKIKHVFGKEQPLRKKLNIIYYSVRNNALAKYLEAAALEIVAASQAQTKGQPAPLALNVDVVTKDGTTPQSVRKGFAEKSGLKGYLAAVDPASRGEGELTSKEVAAGVKKRQGTNKRPVLGERSDAFAAQGPASKGRADKVYGKSEGLSWEDQPTLTRADLPDITADEIRLLQERSGQKPSSWISGRNKKKWAAQTTERVPWEMGVGNIEVLPGSETRRIADKFRARLDAGISGSTDLMMHAGVHLGLTSEDEKKQLRLALVAWMLSNRDHSFYEIMTAASGYGVKFNIDDQRPGAEYEEADNFYPLPATDVAAFANLVPAKKMPSWYLGDAHVSELAKAARQERKRDGLESDYTKAATSVGADITGVSKDLGESIVAHQEKLRAQVEASNFAADPRTEDELRGNRVAVHKLRDDASFQHLALRHPQGALYAEQALEGAVTSKWPDALVSVGRLAGEGVMAHISAKAGAMGRLDLARLVVAVRDAPSDAAARQVSNSLAYLGVKRFLGEPDRRVVLRDLLVKHRNISVPQADAYFRSAQEPTSAAALGNRAEKESAFLVGLGIPRAMWEEPLSGGTGRYDPTKDRNASRAATVRLAVEHLRRRALQEDFPGQYPKAWKNTTKSAEFAELVSALGTDKTAATRVGQAVAAKLIEAVYGPAVNQSHGDQEKLATALSYRMSPADLTRTGGSHEIDAALLETPAAFKASKVQTAKYWGAAAAKDQFKKNVDSLLPDAIKQQFTTTPATLAKAKDLLVDGTTAQAVANLRQLVTKPADLKDGLTEIGLKEDTDVNGATFIADVKAKVVPVVNSWDVDEVATQATNLPWDTVRDEILGANHPLVANKAAVDALSPREQGALFRYTTKLHEHIGYATQRFDITTAASEAEPGTTDKSAKPARGLDFGLPLVAALQSGLSRLPAYTGGSTYHGTASLPGEVKKAAAALASAGNDANAKKKAQDLLDVAIKNAYPKGSIVSFAYPFSTAKRADKSFAASGTKPLAYVVEQPIKSGKDVSLLSDKPNEEEVLFPQGVRFKVVKASTAQPSALVGAFPGVKVWVRVTEA